MAIWPPSSLEPEWRSQSPADWFVKAIVSGDFLQYCDTPARDNLKLILHVREIPGKIEGIFQDPPTFELHLRSEPLRYMHVVEDSRTLSMKRSYNWVYFFCLELLFGPNRVGRVIRMSQRAAVWNQVAHMKRQEQELELGRAAPLVRPRPLRSVAEVVQGLDNLTIGESTYVAHCMAEERLH